MRLRAQRTATVRFAGPLSRRWQLEPEGPVGLPSGYRALDASLLADAWDPEEIARGSFEFLNERRQLGPHVRWDPPDASQLWLFHHHYWEWAWSLAAAPDRTAARATFARQWTSWRTQTQFGRWNAWAPYPVSLRAWVLVNVFDDLVAGSDLEQVIVDDLGRHAGFLVRNLELDLGGNHLLKNLKALYGLGVFLHIEALVASAQRRLVRELAVQVLPDGGHYELSPSYHCQVLGDLVDIAELLAAAGRPAVPELDDAIDRMRTWLGAVLMPDGDVPMLNDCEPVPPERIAALAPHDAPDAPLTILADSGYVVVRRGPFHLVADVGQPGPEDLPAHAHADTLSFELAVDDRRTVVDAGTSEYGSGPRRRFERSTAAHNTVEVDDTDSSEVWGAFRVGRRARATLERADDARGVVVVTASHDGYRHLDGSPVHRRTWVIDDRTVTITDHVTGTGRHRVAHRLTFPAAVARDAGSRQRREPAEGAIEGLTIDGPRVQGASDPAPSASWRASEHARGFGVLAPADTRELVVDGELPLTIETTLTAGAPHPRTDGRDGR